MSHRVTTCVGSKLSEDGCRETGRWSADLTIKDSHGLPDVDIEARRRPSGLEGPRCGHPEARD